ncbi:MAG: hypothetical protein S4CHLAM20_04220 [Chlamydiia bacterium]|nr:hypothetical protein [Chlamydiia bacterium]
MDKKISQLNDLGAVSDNDFFQIIKANELDPSDKNRKLTVGDFKAAITPPEVKTIHTEIISSGDWTEVSPTEFYIDVNHDLGTKGIYPTVLNTDTNKKEEFNEYDFDIPDPANNVRVESAVAGNFELTLSIGGLAYGSGNVTDGVLYVSKLRGGIGVPTLYDKPYEFIGDAINDALPGQIVRVIDGDFNFPDDNFIFKDKVNIDFLEGCVWNIIEDDNSVDKSIGRIAYNTSDVNCSVTGKLKINVVGQASSGTSFARGFALTGSSRVNIEVRDCYGSSKPGLLSSKGFTLMDCGDDCLVYLKVRDTDALNHSQFAMTNVRGDSVAYVKVGDSKCYRIVSTRNNGQAFYETGNCIGANFRVGDESKATWKADSIINYQGEFYVSPAQGFIGESTSIKIDTPWLYLGLRSSFTNGSEMVVGQMELKHANIVSFVNGALGHNDDFPTLPFKNYIENALTLDNVKLITDGSAPSVAISTVEAGESKVINSLGSISNNALEAGITNTGTFTEDASYKFNFDKTPSNFPNYQRILWAWSDALCVLSGGTNNGDYRRKTITSGRYLASTLDNTGYTPIVLNITDAFSHVDQGVEILNESAITDNEFQELSDSDYLDRLNAFYWFIRVTIQETLIVPTSEMGTGSDSSGHISIDRTSDSHGLADGASGVSCPL